MPMMMVFPKGPSPPSQGSQNTEGTIDRYGLHLGRSLFLPSGPHATTGFAGSQIIETGLTATYNAL